MKPFPHRNLATAARKEALVLFQFQKTIFEEILMIQNHMSALRNKHEALERQINEEETRPLPDTIRIHNLKKEKLRLKEELLN
ncbi:YdcH family protein [uncultured Parasphingorhabdus sp.]|uniref:YdcH family protein n=1 Tax=uncultured Parasphingorhabdus sp. TaxID=2709694 RepID=UPI0030DAE84A|tara:strand:- start:56879 stop:57127 length:249 start_codon:yes stop_codon:yes gene_type:complete